MIERSRVAIRMHQRAHQSQAALRHVRHFQYRRHRWLRNIALLCSRTGAWNEMHTIARTSVVGVEMLLTARRRRQW